MPSEHTLLEIRKLIPAKTAEVNRAKSTAEKLSVLKELEALWRERLFQTEVCSDVGKELRAVEVLKPLFATQKEGATPKEGNQPSPKKMEDKKGGKPLPK